MLDKRGRKFTCYPRRARIMPLLDTEMETAQLSRLPFDAVW